ncbi:MAG TPA: hypothetical protein VFN13_01645 [Rudaea sp.]|nr:hypothetical protein [Rudaea sp.]
MRQLSIALCAAVFGCGFAASASADSHPLTFTLDLLAPCSSGGACSGYQTDIGLQIPADTFTYAQDTSLSGSPYVASLSVGVPIVCDEIGSDGAPGAISAQRIEPSFTNAATGSLLEFNGGGPSIVDLGSVMYDGTLPAGVAGYYSNSNGPQVTCYQINPVHGGPQSRAAGPSGIFANAFEDHSAAEPWISVSTVISPSPGVGQGQNLGVPHPSGIAPLPNQLVYVIQIHNAGGNDGWRLNLGYDFAFFDPTSSGATPVWCVLPPLSSPQPGALQACGTSGSANAVYKLNSNDVQTDTNSVYLQVVMTGSEVAVDNWGTLSSDTYPATASIFPPFGTYPHRFDDKSAVVTSNNQPVLNVGSIVCNNDTTSTSCTIRDQDGNLLNGGVQGQLTTTSSITSSGVVNVNPLAYFVDPNSGITLPGTSAADAMSVSNISCSDPNGILAGPLPGIAIVPHNGSVALDFSFVPSGGLYVSGTATCSATFTTPTGFSPQLTSTQSFTLTMGAATTTHFSVSAPLVATAGVQVDNVVVKALDASDNVVGSYSGSVQFSSTDTGATLPANATLTNGVGTFSAKLVTAGSRKITATDTLTASITGTSAPISVSAAGADHFVVNAPASVITALPFNLSVTAYDPFNNVDTNYAGTVIFSSTDSLAVLPANSNLTFGTGVFTSTLIAVGLDRTITVTDSANPSISGVSGPIEVKVSP